MSSGKSLYNALRVEFEKRFRGNWGARINYTFTKHEDNIYENNQLLENETNVIYNTPDECAYGKCPVLDADYGPSRVHVPHQFNVNGTWRTPGDHPIFGGWALSAVAIMRSGFPVVVTQNSNPLGAYGFSYQRPTSSNLSGGGNPRGNHTTYLSAGDAQLTQGLTLSNSPNNTDSVRSPVLINWDVALEKTTRVYEDAKPDPAVRVHRPLQPRELAWAAHGPGKVQLRKHPGYAGLSRARSSSWRRSPSRRSQPRTLGGGPSGPPPWSAGLRPASRGSAKPAHATLRHAKVRTAPYGAPVSDRHRAGARNQRT